MKDGDTYHHAVMCGRHWRLGPKRLRHRDRALRRLAKKRGWTDRIAWLHHRNWESVRRAVEEGGRIDMTEINAIFGWE
ncbi:hypothetical protein [Sphingomonas sp. SRS2]|uniref:hypothetical protein n=1 Tax=Sphingomonas sp. SRS2 TaxID=133190 RepID=UPI00128B1C9C|nr:hypothetical protein [Sphingomonas sp. SRS2]